MVKAVLVKVLLSYALSWTLPSSLLVLQMIGYQVHAVWIRLAAIANCCLLITHPLVYNLNTEQQGGCQLSTQVSTCSAVDENMNLICKYSDTLLSNLFSFHPRPSLELDSGIESSAIIANNYGNTPRSRLMKEILARKGRFYIFPRLFLSNFDTKHFLQNKKCICGTKGDQRKSFTVENVRIKCPSAAGR